MTCPTFLLCTVVWGHNIAGKTFSNHNMCLELTFSLPHPYQVK